MCLAGSAGALFPARNWSYSPTLRISSCWTRTGQARRTTSRQAGRASWARSAGRVGVGPSVGMGGQSVLGLRTEQELYARPSGTRMRTAIVVFAIGLGAALIPGPQIASQDKSAPVKSDKPEWTDLFAKQFKDWTRDGVGKSPWRMTADGNLACAAAEDALGPNRHFKDGTLKFEYRFTPVTGAAK